MSPPVPTRTFAFLGRDLGKQKERMELRRKRPIYDLNKPEDRAYLLKRGFVWAVIYGSSLFQMGELASTSPAMR